MQVFVPTDIDTTLQHCCCRLVPGCSRGSPVRVEVVESDYQPINTKRKSPQNQVLLAVRHRVSEPGGCGGNSPSPSLLLVLVKTYGLQYLVSALYRIPSDLLMFVNPLILK